MSSVLSSVSSALPAAGLLTGSSTSGTRNGTLAGGLLKNITSGLGIRSLTGLLSGLFGGGKPKAEEPLPRFLMPPSLAIEAGFSRSQSGLPGRVDYSYAGSPRMQQSVQRAEQPTPTAVNVTVQTLDSRSFLDNSEAIARAVREAMLHSHSLNDVIAEM
ncbi:MAG TPA: hypothetical protein DEH78_13380 [Solibacterales bacterium]|nr:hypothetical protein [Bryobacterales bacterium]